MPNFYSNCGSMIKKDYKFYLNCGTQIQITTDLSSFENQVDQPPNQQLPVQTPLQATIPPPKQQTGYTQSYAPIPPKKSNKKLITAIIATVIIFVVICIIFFLFLGRGSDSRFVGEWDQESGYITISWTFKSDGSFESMGIEVGTWNINGNQLCIKPSEMWEGYSNDICFDYKFSNNDNTLTLTNYGIEYAVLTKK